MTRRACFVYYHIPADHDDPEHPNVFQINKQPNEIRLKDVKHRFPLPGVYHFRFKLEDKPSSYVWVDVNTDESKLPFFKDKVIAKVLRIAWDKCRTPYIPKQSDSRVEAFSERTASVAEPEKSGTGSHHEGSAAVDSSAKPNQAEELLLLDSGSASKKEHTKPGDRHADLDIIFS